MSKVLEANKVSPTERKNTFTPKPKWLRVKLPTGQNYKNVRGLVKDYGLHTICESGNCPNMGECWGAGTATFMILGNVCTRSCGFCAVATGRPDSVDWDELTSVDRDDLRDGGSIIWKETVQAVRRMSAGTTMETLIPDFKGEWHNIDRIVEAEPEIVSHNIETVRRLTRQVRIQAQYDRSLAVLKYLKEEGLPRTKSGMMLGLGEKEEEVIQSLNDLRKANVDIVTLGQYLQPTTKHLPVQEFVTPEQFEKYKEIGLGMGFRYVESGPLVRSSYHAERHMF
jgi:lipoic acid synthetase